MKVNKLASAFMAGTIALSVSLSATSGYIPVASASVSNSVATPGVSIPSGRYEQSVSVSLSSATAGSDIYYTLDGTMPDDTSLKYNGAPIELTATTNLSVIAEKDDIWSEPATYGYIIASTEQPLLKFAAMSDIHIGPGTSDLDAETRARFASNFDVLSSIFPNPDAILIAGDIINDNGNGKGPDHQYARSVLEEQLTRKNWTNVPVQIAIGNHDASVAEVKQYYPDGWFTDQPNGYYEKTIGGYSFFFLNGNNYNGDTGQRNWLKSRLQEITSDPANVNKPIFITLHHPVTGTVMDGQQSTNTNLYADLKDFPQVIVMSGHSHLDINDDRSIYQKDFTSVNLGSMSYIEVDHGYSAVTEEGLVDSRFEFPEQQSQIVEVYKDRVEIQRVEYNGDPGSVYLGGVWQGPGHAKTFRSAGAIAGQKWVIKLQGNTNEEIKSHFTYTNNTRNKTAPQFPANPELAMLPGANNVPVLSFRQAKDDQSMHHYEINLYDPRTAQVVKTYNVLSDFYFSPIPNKMNIPLKGLNPGTSYIINIKAVDAYGNKSESLQLNYRTDGSAPELTPIDPNTMWNQLVSDMKFEGNLNEDATGTTGQATMAGNVSYVPGKSGQAVSIPAGNANYVDLGDRADLKFGSGDFTVSFWHAGNLVGDQSVISNKDWDSGKNPGWYIGPATSNTITLNMADGTNRIDYSPSSVGQEWHLVTITVDRTNKLASTYVDGALTVTKDLSSLGTSSMDTPYHVIIGADGKMKYGGSAVTMDDLKIWKRALSATEAKALSDSYQSASSMYTFSQLTDLVQEADQFSAYINGTAGLSLPIQAQSDLTARLASAKAHTDGDAASAIDQSYMDLMWALKYARQTVVYSFIPKSAFSIDSSSSFAANENAVASNILDGAESTIWHSKYEEPAAPFPHWVIVDMKDTYKLSGIQRKSRLSQSAMEFPKTFELYASDRLADLSDPAFLDNDANKASGTFGKTWTGNVYTDFVKLDKAVQGRYVKFLVTGTYNADLSKTYTSLSELDFTGEKISTTPVVPPVNPPVNPPVQPDNAVTIQDKDLQDGSTSISVALTNDQNRILIPANLADKLKGRTLNVQAHGVTLRIPGAIIASALPATDSNFVITVLINPVSEQQGSDAATKASSKDSGLYKLGGQGVGVSFVVMDKAGNEQSFKGWTQPVTATFPIPAGLNSKLVGVYEIREDGSVVYAGGKRVNSDAAIEAAIKHPGNYILLSFEKNYDDVPNGHWAFSTIQELTAQHIVNGATNEAFQPAKEVTRAEFAALLVRSLGLASSGKAAFGDVEEQSWYAEEVSAAYEAGIVAGDSELMFRPNRSISREEMAVMLVRAYELMTGTKLENTSAELKDASDISDWAMSDVNRAIQSKLLTGRKAGQFFPAEHTTRAEAAQAIYNLLN
ncbi:S-layer homology domain-containing protein [Paenibacillus glycanilyticus]|uniref:Metallophosphoesterase n=1 Tax=Paenibacillus glycanilyticus TaxID=126569 RepID=A0ABQ6GBK4_9BACL|nr:S-layer homology domain-containing protein [Paenibacillus glycanilyticus]GLX66457.1 hypothetical protein MU1_08010 [Paenibacillus glycanilyticus]